MNRNLWKFLLGLGVCPFVIPVILGFCRMAIESWTMLDWLILYSFVWWPTYLIGGVLIIAAAVRLKKK